MIFEELNGNTVIIELSLEEMESYSVTYDTLNCETVKSILSRAGELYGKIPRTERVTVEALPSDDGGCFFIFTFPPEKRRYRVKKAENENALVSDSLDDVLDCVSAFKKRGAKRKSCPLFFSDSKYLLLLPAVSENEAHIISEFGSLKKLGGVNIKRLSEHGKYMGEITV